MEGKQSLLLVRLTWTVLSDWTGVWQYWPFSLYIVTASKSDAGLVLSMPHFWQFMNNSESYGLWTLNHVVFEALHFQTLQAELWNMSGKSENHSRRRGRRDLAARAAARWVSLLHSVGYVLHLGVSKNLKVWFWVEQFFPLNCSTHWDSIFWDFEHPYSTLLQGW